MHIFLLIGTTDAILALFGKVEVLMLFLMAVGSAETSEANLTSLIGILSIPCVFGEFKDFIVVLVPLGFILRD